MGVFKPILLNTQSGGQIARALASGDLGPNAISSGNIASGAVTPGTLSSGAVQSGNLGNAAVNSGNIGPNAVVSGNLASGAVTPGTVASGAVTSGGLGNGAVTSGNIASGQVGVNQLASGVLAGATVAEANFINDPTILTAAEPISGGYCVSLNSSGLAVNSQAGVIARMPAIGVEASGALSGALVSLQQDGRMYSAQYNFSGSLGLGLFVGASGLPVVTPPSASGQSVQRIGTPWVASGLLVNPGGSTLISDT